MIVTATGLKLLPLGGIELAIDGITVDLPDHTVYKGMMLDNVPNLAMAVGYTNASWTLKCDLTCEYVCRLLAHMDRHGYREVVAVNSDDSVARQPLIDLNSGYVQRALADFPSQGSKPPWRLYQNYPRDVLMLRLRDLDDGVLRFAPGAPDCRSLEPDCPLRTIPFLPPASRRCWGRRSTASPRWPRRPSRLAARTAAARAVLAALPVVL